MVSFLMMMLLPVTMSKLMQIVIRVWNKQFASWLYLGDKSTRRERAVDVSYPDGKDYQDFAWWNNNRLLYKKILE